MRGVLLPIQPDSMTDQVYRATFDLAVYAPEILAHDAERHELNAAKERDYRYDRGPALDHVAAKQFLQNRDLTVSGHVMADFAGRGKPLDSAYLLVDRQGRRRICWRRCLMSLRPSRR